MAERVWLVSTTAGGVGHATGYLNRLGEALAAEGMHVGVIAPPDFAVDPPAAAAGVWHAPAGSSGRQLDAARFRRFGRGASAVRGFARVAASAQVLGAAVARARAGDVVHFIDYEYAALSAALTALHARGIRTAVTLHPSDFDGSTGGLGGAYKRMIRPVLAASLKGAGVVVCHGPWIAKRVREQLRIGGGPNAPAVIDAYYPSDGYGARAGTVGERKRPGQGGERRLRVLWFGLIRRNKRLDVALASLAALPADVELHVAGHPAELNQESIEAMVRQHGLEGRVTLDLRYLDDEAADRAFAGADVLLATHEPSFTSASGPVADARCYGLPVVVTDAGQLSAYVRDTDVGVVSEAHEPGAFARALLQARARLDEQPQWRREIVECAAELSWRGFGRRHAAAYRQGHGAGVRFATTNGEA